MCKHTDENTCDLDAAYKEMAQDQEREAEALEWAEGTIQDFDDEMQISARAPYSDSNLRAVTTKNLRESAS